MVLSASLFLGFRRRSHRASKSDGDCQPIIGDWIRNRRSARDHPLCIRRSGARGAGLFYGSRQRKVPPCNGEAGHDPRSRRRFRSSPGTAGPPAAPPRFVPAATLRISASSRAAQNPLAHRLHLNRSTGFLRGKLHHISQRPPKSFERHFHPIAILQMHACSKAKRIRA